MAMCTLLSEVREIGVGMITLSTKYCNLSGTRSSFALSCE